MAGRSRSRSAWSGGGGGWSDQARQQRHRSRLVPARPAPAAPPGPTARRAGHEGARVAAFPPPGRSTPVESMAASGAGPARWGMALRPPAEGKRTLHQRPMAAHARSERTWYWLQPRLCSCLLVRLLHPHPQPVKPHHLGQIRISGRQRSHQVPRRRLRAASPDRGWQSPGGVPGPDRTARRLLPAPTRLLVPIAEVPRHRHPGPRLLGTDPAARAATSQTAPMASTGAHQPWEGLSATTYGTPRCAKPAREAMVLAVQAIGHYRPERPGRGQRPSTSSRAIWGLVRKRGSALPRGNQGAGV